MHVTLNVVMRITAGGSLLRMDADLPIGSRVQTLVGRWCLMYLKVGTKRFGPGMSSNHFPGVLIVAVYHQLLKYM